MCVSWIRVVAISFGKTCKPDAIFYVFIHFTHMLNRTGIKSSFYGTLLDTSLWIVIMLLSCGCSPLTGHGSSRSRVRDGWWFTVYVCSGVQWQRSWDWGERDRQGRESDALKVLLTFWSSVATCVLWAGDLGDPLWHWSLQFSCWTCLNWGWEGCDHVPLSIYVQVKDRGLHRPLLKPIFSPPHAILQQHCVTILVCEIHPKLSRNLFFGVCWAWRAFLYVSNACDLLGRTVLNLYGLANSLFFP